MFICKPCYQELNEGGDSFWWDLAGKSRGTCEQCDKPGQMCADIHHSKVPVKPKDWADDMASEVTRLKKTCVGYIMERVEKLKIKNGIKLTRPVLHEYTTGNGEPASAVIDSILFCKDPIAMEDSMCITGLISLRIMDIIDILRQLETNKFEKL